MKQKLKRIGALLLTAAMALALCLPALASEVPLTGTPGASDSAPVKVSGLKEGDSVTFYQIVKANYADGGFTGYEAVADSTIAVFDESGNAVYPTAAQAAALAADTSSLTASGPYTAGPSGEVEQALAAGEWLAIVTPGADNVDTVYNPLVLSVYYTADGASISGGELALGKDTAYSLNGQEGYVKKSEIPFDKKIVAGEDRPDVQGAHGDDLAIGDTVNFSIETTIPAYSDAYESVVFNITDQMDDSLDLDEGSIKVTVGGEAVEAGAGTYAVTTSGHGFEIAFASGYALSLGSASDAARAVEVTYSAVLNDAATVNFDENNNKASVEFTNKPDTDADTVKKEKETHQYTFEIDGNINGSEKEVNRKGHELIKVNEKGEPEVVDWIDDGTEETTIETGLAGARFSLTYVEDADGNEVPESRRRVYTATTDANGYFNGFTGLDAGKYILVETAAPEGYSLNTQEHTVLITAQYNEEGYLVSFSITIDGEATSTYTASYEGGKVTEITTEGDPETTFIKNIKPSELPSTGGAGTWLLTIVGVAVFALAVGLARAGRVNRN